MSVPTKQREYTDSQTMTPDSGFDFFRAKMAFTTGPVELRRAIDRDEVNVVDVRAGNDYDEGHIPGAVSLPRDLWETAQGLVKDRPNVFVCYSIVCHLAAHAARDFAAQGYPVMELDGGMREWRVHEMPIEVTQ